MWTRAGFCDGTAKLFGRCSVEACFEEDEMDRDRVEGSARTVTGRVKEFFGRLFGDTKLTTDGQADQVAGKVQNTVGGIKDSLRGDRP
jgi:uncharacterized protein YjbJ (UPF0337 family)